MLLHELASCIVGRTRFFLSSRSPLFLTASKIAWAVCEARVHSALAVHSSLYKYTYANVQGDVSNGRSLLGKRSKRSGCLVEVGMRVGLGRVCDRPDLLVVAAVGCFRQRTRGEVINIRESLYDRGSSEMKDASPSTREGSPRRRAS